MKKIMTLWIFLFAIVLSGCDSSPESIVKGEWDYADLTGEKGSYRIRMKIIPGDRIEQKQISDNDLMNRRIDIDKILESKERDGKVAIRVDCKTYYMEKKGDKLIVEVFSPDMSLDDVLDKVNYDKSREMVYGPLNKDADFRFNFEPYHNLFAKKWYAKNDPKREILEIEGNSGNLKLHDKEYIKENGGKKEASFDHYEELIINDALDVVYSYPTNIGVSFISTPDEKEGFIYVGRGRVGQNALDFSMDNSDEHKKNYARIQDSFKPYLKWVDSEMKTKNGSR